METSTPVQHAGGSVPNFPSTLSLSVKPAFFTGSSLLKGKGTQSVRYLGMRAKASVRSLGTNAKCERGLTRKNKTSFSPSRLNPGTHFQTTVWQRGRCQTTDDLRRRKNKFPHDKIKGLKTKTPICTGIINQAKLVYTCTCPPPPPLPPGMYSLQWVIRGGSARKGRLIQARSMLNGRENRHFSV